MSSEQKKGVSHSNMTCVFLLCEKHMFGIMRLYQM